MTLAYPDSPRRSYALALAFLAGATLLPVGAFAQDISLSTKQVVNIGGGDAVVGSTLEYTVSVVESSGFPDTNVTVTDDIPANVTNFTVTSIPAGATDSSTGAGTGANGTGFLNVTGINVAGNGTVNVVFTVQVAAGTPNCTTIDNTATVFDPFGSFATPAAPTIVVAQSTCTASGNKILYLYDNTGPTYLDLLNRVVQANTTTTPITIAGGSNHVWNLSPFIAGGKQLILPAENIAVRLIETATGANVGTNRPTTVTILNNGVPIATSGTINIRNGPAGRTYTIAIPATTIAAGTALSIQFNNNSGVAARAVAISQNVAGRGRSRMTFFTSTVINVDSVILYNAAYPATTTQPVFVPGQTVYLCAVVSDPFGGYDANSANVTITDPNGTVQVNAAAMTAEGPTDCSGTANGATEAFEYVYTTPAGGPIGFWTTQVTANEGTEGTITHTANGSFDLDVPSLLVMKTVLVNSDPVEGTVRPKAIPGAVMQYNVTVQNSGRGPVDRNSLVIADPVPANTTLSLPAKPPFAFVDGGTASGLSVTAGSDANIVYSNNGGASYVYVPSCARPCTDATITNFKITLSGRMNGKIGVGTPSFSVLFNVVIK